MTDVPAIPRPSLLWKQLSSDRKVAAAGAFWRDDNAHIEQAEAVAAIAQRIKFRALSVLKMPVEKKAQYLATLPGVSDIMAARLLVAYHLDTQRPMMGSFLDALGIKHEEGLIADEDVQTPAAETLKGAAATIATQYPAEDVALYLSTLVWQDPETWGALSDAPEVQAVA